MNSLRDVAHKLDPALWVREVLGQEPSKWQEQFLLAPRGASLLALTARQTGKTTAAAWAIAHHMIHYDNSLSVVVCPAQRQSGELIRRVKDSVRVAKADLDIDNTYTIELKNRSRALALPGTDESIRGLSVDGWIIADEAARLSSDLIAAVRPMRARHPQTRLAMLSTAWSRTDPFWQAWESDNDDWVRLKVTADMPDCPLSPQHLAEERAALGEDDYKREYLGIPAGAHTSPFTWELYEAATKLFTPRNAPGEAFRPARIQPGRMVENPFKAVRP
jgi:Terminase large subunit, T4likevirus-type, N-terminal